MSSPCCSPSSCQHKGWLVAHIILIFTGYAALLLSFGASLLYLLQERRLKAKKPSSLISFLPALEVIDQIGYRSLLLGFPFMTLGLLDRLGRGDLHLRARRFSGSEDSAVDPDVGRLHGHGLHALEFGMARTPRRRPGDFRVRGRASWPGPRTISRPSTGLPPHEIPAHWRESQERAARSARAPGDPESRLPDACRDLTAHPGIEEGMIISTCNRVEIDDPHHQRRRRPARISARSLSS